MGPITLVFAVGPTAPLVGPKVSVVTSLLRPSGKNLNPKPAQEKGGPLSFLPLPP